jgi:iron(III) transport system ATP-binding protein/putative spermidine/putrescine transport system ATP-binding protein
MGITNLLSGAVALGGSSIQMGGIAFAVPKLALADGTRVTLSLRPEALRPLQGGEQTPKGWAMLSTKLMRIEFLGAIIRIEAQLGDGTPLRAATLDRPFDHLQAGDEIRFAYDPARAMVFPA